MDSDAEARAVVLHAPLQLFASGDVINESSSNEREKSSQPCYLAGSLIAPDEIEIIHTVSSQRDEPLGDGVFIVGQLVPCGGEHGEEASGPDSPFWVVLSRGQGTELPLVRCASCAWALFASVHFALGCCRRVHGCVCSTSSIFP